MLGLSSPKGACQRLGLSSPQVVVAIQAKRCLPKVWAIQPTSGWGYPAQKVLAKGWGYPAHKWLGLSSPQVVGAIQPKRCLPKVGAIQPKSVWAIQPRKCCQKLVLSSPKVVGLSSPRGAATGRCCFFSPMPFCLCFSQLSSSLSKL